MPSVVDENEKKEEVSNNGQEISEPEYVVVASSPSDEPLELPTSQEDGTLGMSTLVHAFPGAHGLKYKNPKTGASRALLIDSTGTRFFPPVGGWTDKVFIVIYQAEPSKRTMPGEQNPKRKKMMDDAVSSGSEDGDNLHGAQVSKVLRLNKGEDGIDERSKKDVCCDLLILGLPYSLEEDELKEYFERYGAVSFVEIKKNSSGESRGFGFVKMTNIADQKTVLDAPSHLIGGRKCFVKIPMSKNGDAAKDVRAAEDVRLFVGRLSDKISYKRLRDFFTEEAQKIDSNVSITDAFIPNPFRGFGFINLTSTAVAKELLKKDDFIIDGTAVSISIASPKQSLKPPQFPPFDMPISTGNYDRYEQRRDFDYYEHQPQYGAYPDPWENNRRPPGSSRQYGDMFESSPYEGPYAGNSNSISSGLETLNLNNMKPDVMNEALKAFWSAASRNQAAANYQQPNRPHQPHSRRNHQDPPHGGRYYR